MTWKTSALQFLWATLNGSWASLGEGYPRHLRKPRGAYTGEHWGVLGCLLCSDLDPPASRLDLYILYIHICTYMCICTYICIHRNIIYICIYLSKHMTNVFAGDHWLGALELLGELRVLNLEACLGTPKKRACNFGSFTGDTDRAPLKRI